MTRFAAAGFVVALAFAYALPAHAAPLDVPLDGVPRLMHLDLHLDVPALQLASDVPALDLAGAAVAAATPSITVPPRYGWILDDGRAFWFAAGASSVVALGTHVLVGLPTLLVGVPAASAIAQASPAATVPFLLGLGGAYVLAQSALSALAAMLVFDSVSKVYDGNYLVAFAAQVAGSILGAAVSALSFGVGFMLVGGLNGLVEFTGSAGVQAIEVFSFLGALPAVVIGGIALVGVPALVSAWALSVSATPKEGYAINPAWNAPPPETSSLTLPLVTIPLPG